MIDTVRFLIPVDKKQFALIRLKSKETMRFNHDTKNIEAHYWTVSTNLGSFQRGINIFLSDLKQDQISIELSLPKYFYGHNIYLLYESQLQECLSRLFSDLFEYFGSFPDLSLWKVQRLDLCYAWKYRTQEQADQILSTIRSFKYPRKRVSFFDTSVMYIGSSYSVKWYLKAPEFHKHDFREMKLRDLDRAYQLLGFSEGVLRFEVTLRKASFKTHFGRKDFSALDLLTFSLQEKLEFFFNKALEFDSDEFMNSSKIFQRLKKRFDGIKAGRLYAFYLACNTENPEDKKNVYSTLSQSQIRRNLNDLRKAKVGLLTTQTNPNFNLTLPSTFATSDDPGAPFTAASSFPQRFVL